MDKQWCGRPSKLIDLPMILLGLLVLAFSVFMSIFTGHLAFTILSAILIFCVFIKIIDSPSPTYKLKNRQLIIKQGTLRKKNEYIELFRVKDISTSSNFFCHFWKIGKIKLFTTDHTLKEVELKLIKNYIKVADLIREQVLEAKKNNNTQEIDIE